MRFLLVTVAIFTVGHSASAAEPANCKALKTPAARLACYEKQDSSSAAKGFGKLKGVITWQYNKFVGTKGDVGANVVAIRTPVTEAIGKLSAPESGMLSLGIALPGWEKHGIHVAEADGFGNYSIDGVPVGSYEIFVFSRKTTPGPDDFSTNSCKTRFDELFKDKPDYKPLAFKIHKAYCTSVTIQDERESTVSHDFGNTYI